MRVHSREHICKMVHAFDINIYKYEHKNSELDASPGKTEVKLSNLQGASGSAGKIFATMLMHVSFYLFDMQHDHILKKMNSKF